MQTQANMKTNLWECYYGSISSLSISPKITHLCFNVLSTEIPRSYCRTWNCRENSVNSDQTHRTTAKQRCVHTPELSHQEGVLYAPQGLCRKSREDAAVAWIGAGAQCSFFTSVALGSSEEICRICESLTLSNVK